MALRSRVGSDARLRTRLCRDLRRAAPQRREVRASRLADRAGAAARGNYGATLLRVYEKRSERRAYAFFAIWVTDPKNQISFPRLDCRLALAEIPPIPVVTPAGAALLALLLAALGHPAPRRSR